VDLEANFAPFKTRLGSVEEYNRFLGYTVFRETVRYRIGRLTILLNEPLVVFGEKDWAPFLPRTVLHPPVDHLKQTPAVYAHSAINLSLTTFQHPTALNQRHFDVPICNGFLLSDWQEALAEHFVPDQEVVYFRNDEELQDKVHHYLKHPGARETVTQKARERIEHEHLVSHRVDTILDTVRRVCS
jgi:spore maturation protein CgeB